MKKEMLFTLGSLLVGGAVAFAQDRVISSAAPAATEASPTEKAAGAAKPAAPTPEILPRPADSHVHATGDSPAVDYSDPVHCGPRIWATSEYLLWWVKNGAVSIPLAETGTLAFEPVTGVASLPHPTVVLGDSDLDYGSFTGFRETVGGWLDADRTAGVEVSGFFLSQRSVDARANSDSTGNPALVVPYQQSNGSPGLLLIARDLAPGGISTSSSSRLWGMELNYLANVSRSNRFQLDALAGIRYLDLQENLGVGAFETQNNPPFDGPYVVTTSDLFQTRDQFYGCQVGARASYLWNRLSVDLQAKVGLGSTHQVLNVGGVTTIQGSVLGSVIPSPLPGGIFAQQSNMGRFTRDDFSVVPQVGLQFSYHLNRYVRAFVGYDFLYWSQVIRPGDQINNFTLPTANQLLAFTNGLALAGAPRPEPVPLFKTTDYWAQGIAFGLEFRF